MRLTAYRRRPVEQGTVPRAGQDLGDGTGRGKSTPAVPLLDGEQRQVELGHRDPFDVTELLAGGARTLEIDARRDELTARRAKVVEAVGRLKGAE